MRCSNTGSVSYTHLTLWNAVDNCEKHPKAQLAYSFDIAMQNELTLEENMELARKFVQEQFVTKGSGYSAWNTGVIPARSCCNGNV